MRIPAFLLMSLLGASAAMADTVTIPFFTTESSPQNIGTVLATDTNYGLLLTPDLKGLPPGIHGFHIHQNPNCADGGQAAGGHLDPQKTEHHHGPYNKKGHMGDLPILYVNQAGQSSLASLAPRLSVAEIRNHSVIIHAGGDNYADTPKPLGGGGARIACGIVPAVN